MLGFNFCALLIYEILLVATAIALARRGVWYDALLLRCLRSRFHTDRDSDWAGLNPGAQLALG
jgi:hypothetical protein